MAKIQHNEVSLPLANGWEDGSQLVALGPVDNGFRPNVVITREPVRGETVDKYAARQLGMLRQQLQGFAVLKEGPARYGPHAGFLREYSFTMQGHKLSQLQFYVVRGSTAYAMTFTHLANRIANTRKVAEDAFGAIKFE